MASLAAYGRNVNAAINVNSDHGWGGYQYPDGVPDDLLGIARYGSVKSIVRKELVVLFGLAYQIAADVHGYTIYSENPNGNGEIWGPWGYENRVISGSNVPSNHSRGKANDWNAPLNPYASGSRFTSDFPIAMVADLESIGLCWGGRYGDAMHWEYGYSPDDVAGHEQQARAFLGGKATGTPIKPEDDSMSAAEVAELKKYIDDKLAALPDAVWNNHFENTTAAGAPASVGDIVGATLREMRDFRGETGPALSAMPTNVWIKSITPEPANVLLARAAGAAPAAPPPATYTVVAGDSFNAIAAKLGVTPDALGAANPQVKDRSNLDIGQVLNKRTR